MSAVSAHGIRHGFLPGEAQANPMKYVRQSGQSTREHTIVTTAETVTILTSLKEPSRRWPCSMQRRHCTSVSCWQTFRRSISTWLIDNDEDVKVTQELLRHSPSKTTLDLYARANPAKRRAHTRILDDLLTASRNAGSRSMGGFVNLGANVG